MIYPRDRSTEDHVGDLLPALINGTLDSETAMRMRGHLDRCAACREELTEWEAIAMATRTYAARQQATVPALSDLWAEIEPSTPSQSANGAPSHPAQAQDTVRQGTARSNRRGRARQSRGISMSTTTLPTARPHFTLPTWTRHLHGVSTGLMIVVIVALAAAAWGLNGMGGNGGGVNPNDNFAAVTGSPVTNNSSRGCTLEPMNRDAMVSHLQAANVATKPEYELYEQPQEPSAEESVAIVQTYREWQACALLQNGGLQAMRFQSPWFTANTSGLFLDPSLSSTHRPISDEEIEAFVDVLLDETTPTPDVGGQTAIEPYPTVSPGESAASAGSGGEQTSNRPWYPTPAIPLVSVPTGGTPVASEEWSPMNPVIVAADIVLIGPDTANASAHVGDPRTGEVLSGPPITYTFVKVDGRWLIDSVSDAAR